MNNSAAFLVLSPGRSLAGFFQKIGTDSPSTDQKEMLDRTLRLKISDRLKEKMLYHNAEDLLGLNKASKNNDRRHVFRG
jgi:hypothetical protein